MRWRKTLRLRDFDYASENLYLVTVCTYQRCPILGAIVGESVVPSLSARW